MCFGLESGWQELDWAATLRLALIQKFGISAFSENFDFGGPLVEPSKVLKMMNLFIIYSKMVISPRDMDFNKKTAILWPISGNIP